jgi:hypothetical protein
MFIDLARSIYASTPQWVPFLEVDYRAMFKRKHPYFHKTEAEFFLIMDGTVPVGRTMVAHNERYNEQHNTRACSFYFTDFTDDEGASSAVFSAVSDWALHHDAEILIGPLLSGATFGGGVLIDGFEHRAAMTMMPYNHPYYEHHYTNAGFQKRFDLNSLGIDPKQYVMPERVERLANRVRERGRMEVLRFSSKGDLRRVATRVAALYNDTLADHTENYPLTDAELDQLIKDLLLIADPPLEKIITYDKAVVGFMLAFPDVSEALQRSGGKLTARSLIDLLLSKRRATKLLLNGMGILERYQRLGGNALIYSELARTLADPRYDFVDAEMVQINEQTELMLSDMYRLGATRRKLHRVYDRRL